MAACHRFGNATNFLAFVLPREGCAVDCAISFAHAVQAEVFEKAPPCEGGQARCFLAITKQAHDRVGHDGRITGWHQQATFLEFYINANKWKSLSEQHRAMIESACGDLTRDVIAEGEATQWRAMTEMRDKNGVQIKKWSPEILAAFEKAWNEVIAEESKANPNFKRVYDSYAKFRKDYAIWREHGYVN